MKRKWLGLFIAMIFALSACRSVNKIQTSYPQGSLEAFINALKDGDVELAAQYVVDSDAFLQSDLLQSAELSELKMPIAFWFKQVTVKVLSEKKEEETAILGLSVKSPDLKNLIQEFITQYGGDFLSMTDQQMQTAIQNFVVSALSGKAKKMETEVTVALVKEETEWKILMNDEFAAALLGGLGPDEWNMAIS